MPSNIEKTNPRETYTRTKMVVGSLYGILDSFIVLFTWGKYSGNYKLNFIIKIRTQEIDKK